MKIFGFLNGFTREYDPIATVIQSSLTKIPAPTFNDVISKGLTVNSRRKLQTYEEQAQITPHLAFNSQPNQSQQEYRNTALMYNHNYRGRGRTGFTRGRGGYSTRGRGFTQHQYGSGSLGERPVGQICGRTSHTALKCYNRFDNNYQGAAAYASLRVADENGREWYPDFGVSAHVTSSTKNLQEAPPYEGSDVVMVGDVAFLPITHVGSAAISSSSCTLSLTDVLVCPVIKKSLLYVSKLCDDQNYGVFFDANDIYVIDLDKLRVVAKGPRSNGLYR